MGAILRGEAIPPSSLTQQEHRDPSWWARPGAFRVAGPSSKFLEVQELEALGKSQRTKSTDTTSHEILVNTVVIDDHEHLFFCLVKAMKLSAFQRDRKKQIYMAWFCWWLSWLLRWLEFSVGRVPPAIEQIETHEARSMILWRFPNSAGSLLNLSSSITSRVRCCIFKNLVGTGPANFSWSYLCSELLQRAWNMRRRCIRELGWRDTRLELQTWPVAERTLKVLFGQGSPKRQIGHGAYEKRGGTQENSVRFGEHAVFCRKGTTQWRHYYDAWSLTLERLSERSESPLMANG